MSAHAKLSPSSAVRWLNCPASAGMIDYDAQRESSKYASEGTMAHTLASMCLTSHKPAAGFIGTEMEADGFELTVDADMATHVQTYVDYIKSIKGTRFIESRMDISQITGEPGAEGTADAVILTPDNDEIVVVDLKFGRGVKVDATDNDQLLIYGLAAIDKFDFLGRPERLRVVIVQPRMDNVSEWVMPVDGDLSSETERDRIIKGADVAMGVINDGVRSDLFNPGEPQCRWCPAKADCSHLAQNVLDTVADDFVDMSGGISEKLTGSIERTMDNATLGNCMGSIGLIDMWCTSIRARVEKELLDRHVVPGYKLVSGRKGARTWLDKDLAAKIMKNMRLKSAQMYSRTLISPAVVDKTLVKTGIIKLRAWDRLKEQITQKDGKPSVVPKSDKRHELVIDEPVAEFNVISSEGLL